MKAIIMLSCLLVASAATASAEVPVHLCGRQLAEARLLVCYGEKKDWKRTYPESFRDLFGEDNLITEDWQLKGKRAIFNAALLRHKKVGLAEECCIKACTTDVIRNYC